MTPNQLARIMQCTDARAERWHMPLSAAMQEFGITTPRRQAHFLAQIGHESLSLSRSEEGLYYTTLDNLRRVFGHRIPANELPGYLRKPEALANRVYAGRLGNGNVTSGDGWRYRGRGPTQLTFRDNYAEMGQLLGLPLVENPDLVMDLAVGARVSAGYWHKNRLNPLADANDTVGVSKKINLGDARSAKRPNGLDDRVSRTNRALAILGA